MAYRAFFILLDRAGRVWGTLTLRGGWQAAHPIRSLRNMANVLGLLVVDAADRVQNLYDVMRVRGTARGRSSGTSGSAGGRGTSPSWPHVGHARRRARGRGPSPVHASSAHGRPADGRGPSLVAASGGSVEPIIRVSCVRHTYPDRTSVHLCGLDFVVPPGRRVVVLGPNGSGKTTLLSHILGLLAPDEGTVRVLGVDPAREFSGSARGSASSSRTSTSRSSGRRSTTTSRSRPATTATRRTRRSEWPTRSWGTWESARSGKRSAITCLGARRGRSPWRARSSSGRIFSSLTSVRGARPQIERRPGRLAEPHPSGTGDDDRPLDPRRQPRSADGRRGLSPRGRR